MSELGLTRDERLALRARAHHLNPVVLLGAAGLTAAVMKETDRALAAHELIKIRIPGDDRDQRAAICAQMAEQLGAARIQVIGKLLVLYRPRPELENEPESTATTRRPPKPSRTVQPKSGSARAAAQKPRPQGRTPRAAPSRGGTRSR